MDPTPWQWNMDEHLLHNGPGLPHLPSPIANPPTSWDLVLGIQGVVGDPGG